MGSQVSKGSLTFPSDPLAAMRELGDLDSNTPALTEVRTYGSTDARQDASEEVRAQARQRVRKLLRRKGSTDART